MESNIFENAKYGDKFLTRDNDVYLYISNGNYHSLTHDGMSCIMCDDNGRVNEQYETPLDIVSKYREPNRQMNQIT